MPHLQNHCQTALPDDLEQAAVEQVAYWLQNWTTARKKRIYFYAKSLAKSQKSDLPCTRSISNQHRHTISSYQCFYRRMSSHSCWRTTCSSCCLMNQASSDLLTKTAVPAR